MKSIEYKYRFALEEIIALGQVTEIKGSFYDIGVSEHLISNDGWVPIPPQVKNGIMIAVTTPTAKAVGFPAHFLVNFILTTRFPVAQNAL